MSSKKYPCENCKRELTAGALYDLIELDFKYHRYCKDCIRPSVKKLAEQFLEEKRKHILFDYPRNDIRLEHTLEVINLNITNLIFEKIRENPKFAEHYRKEMEKVMPSLFGEGKVLGDRIIEIKKDAENGETEDE